MNTTSLQIYVYHPPHSFHSSHTPPHLIHIRNKKFPIRNPLFLFPRSGSVSGTAAANTHGARRTWDSAKQSLIRRKYLALALLPCTFPRVRVFLPRGEISAPLASLSLPVRAEYIRSVYIYLWRCPRGMRASRCQRGDGTVIFERRGLRVVGFVLGFFFFLMVEK